MYQVYSFATHENNSTKTTELGQKYKDKSPETQELGQNSFENNSETNV